MSQHYSIPERESDVYALPDVEVFWHDGRTILDADGVEYLPEGWYWWSCFPGCLPDGDPIGPFDTEADAIEDSIQVLE